eukprot:2034407-Amphidinium_carterae.1
MVRYCFRKKAFHLTASGSKSLNLPSAASSPTDVLAVVFPVSCEQCGGWASKCKAPNKLREPYEDDHITSFRKNTVATIIITIAIPTVEQI